MAGSTSKKRDALKFFLDSLTGPGGKGKVGKVYLFGSLAKGTSREGSDIDLVIFGVEDLEEIRAEAGEAFFETWARFRESVEPLVYCMDDYRHPSSPFLLRVLREGEEVFSMAEPDLRRREAEAYLGLAREYLEGARFCLEGGNLRLAADAGYNAIELAAKGLLGLKGLSIPKSHGAVVGELGRVYIRTGLLPEALGRRLHQALELRNRARYDYHSRITPEAAGDVVELATRLIGFLDEALAHP